MSPPSLPLSSSSDIEMLSPSPSSNGGSRGPSADVDMMHSSPLYSTGLEQPYDGDSEHAEVSDLDTSSLRRALEQEFPNINRAVDAHPEEAADDYTNTQRALSPIDENIAGMFHFTPERVAVILRDADPNKLCIDLHVVEYIAQICLEICSVFVNCASNVHYEQQASADIDEEQSVLKTEEALLTLVCREDTAKIMEHLSVPGSDRSPEAMTTHVIKRAVTFPPGFKLTLQHFDGNMCDILSRSLVLLPPLCLLDRHVPVYKDAQDFVDRSTMTYTTGGERKVHCIVVRSNIRRTIENYFPRHFTVHQDAVDIVYRGIAHLVRLFDGQPKNSLLEWINTFEDVISPVMAPDVATANILAIDIILKMLAKGIATNLRSSTEITYSMAIYAWYDNGFDDILRSPSLDFQESLAKAVILCDSGEEIDMPRLHRGSWEPGHDLRQFSIYTRDWRTLRDTQFTTEGFARLMYVANAIRDLMIGTQGGFHNQNTMFDNLRSVLSPADVGRLRNIVSHPEYCPVPHRPLVNVSRVSQIRDDIMDAEHMFEVTFNRILKQVIQTIMCDALVPNGIVSDGPASFRCDSVDHAFVLNGVTIPHLLPPATLLYPADGSFQAGIIRGPLDTRPYASYPRYNRDRPTYISKAIFGPNGGRTRIVDDPIDDHSTVMSSMEECMEMCIDGFELAFKRDAIAVICNGISHILDKCRADPSAYLMYDKIPHVAGDLPIVWLYKRLTYAITLEIVNVATENVTAKTIDVSYEVALYALMNNSALPELGSML